MAKQDEKTPPQDTSSGTTKTKEPVLVEFFGPGREVTHRIINAADFTRHQLDGKKLEFHAENGWTQDVSELNEAALEWLVSQPDMRLKKTADA